MKRVLVPLDGSNLAESILPDALRLAGPDGEILLVRDAPGPILAEGGHAIHAAFEEAGTYLEKKAGELKAKGVKAEAKVLGLYDRAWAIDEAARIYGADAIACATHGRSPIGRVARGSVAWRALSQSDVPVLVRHVENGPTGSVVPEQPAVRHILVPLDGSPLAEKALPLAIELAHDWDASIRIVQVVTMIPPQSMAPRGIRIPIDYTSEIRASHDYLEKIAAALPGNVETAVLKGGVIDTLAGAIEKWSITDVVMASHGHTGLVRVITGSVADGLIHRLHCPIIVIPAHAARLIERPAMTVRSKDLVGSPS